MRYSFDQNGVRKYKGDLYEFQAYLSYDAQISSHNEDSPGESL